MIASIIGVFTMESLKIIANLEVKAVFESVQIIDDSKWRENLRYIVENQAYEDSKQLCDLNCHASKNCPCWENLGERENDRHQSSHFSIRVKCA